MTPLQAQIISAWEGLHPIFKVVPDKKHVPSPGDPWRYIIVQEDNDLVIGAIDRKSHRARHKFNEPPVEQLWNSMVSGHMPRDTGEYSQATPLRDPGGGTLTARPRSAKELNKRENPNPTSEHYANKALTRNQARVLASWEALHEEFRVMPDPGHAASRCSPWGFAVVRRADGVTVGTFERYKQDTIDSSFSQMLNQLRYSFKYNKLPKTPAPKVKHRRDPVSGRLLPKLHVDPSPNSTNPPVKPRLPAGYPPENCAYPPPIPNLGKPAVRTGKVLDLWKYGTHKEWHSDFNKKRKLWI
jgi:hypothetical protein